MTINNKYYFISTDLFHWFRLYLFLTLILIALCVVSSINISLSPLVTTLLFALKLLMDSGQITVINSTQLQINRTLKSLSIINILPYKYWWNYDFNTGSPMDDTSENEAWKLRSNKVIVNLLLQNSDQKIHFKETIRLDTRHPNDAMHLEVFDNSSNNVIHIQRIDKLISFLKNAYNVGDFELHKDFKKID